MGNSQSPLGQKRLEASLIAMNRSPSGGIKWRQGEPSQRSNAVLWILTWILCHWKHPSDQWTKRSRPKVVQMIGSGHANLTSNWEKGMVRSATGRLGSQPPLHSRMDFDVHGYRSINIHRENMAKSTGHQVPASWGIHDSCVPEAIPFT